MNSPSHVGRQHHFSGFRASGLPHMHMPLFGTSGIAGMPSIVTFYVVTNLHWASIGQLSQLAPKSGWSFTQVAAGTALVRNQSSEESLVQISHGRQVFRQLDRQG